MAATAVALALVVAACGSSGSSTKSGAAGTTATTGATANSNPNGQFTLEIDQEPQNWNDLSSDGNEEATINITDRIFPSVFHTLPDYSVKLDSTFMQSATQTNANPQTIEYKINPKAVWADGTPITAADFIYNYQAQSGLPQYKDADGKAFNAASNSGYSQIKSVTQGADPYTVDVVFSTPYPDWQGLFAPLVPAHIAQKIGFNDGFTDPVKDLVSGGPFMVQSYNKGTSITLVRNPKYWGAPAGLSTVTFRFLTDSSAIVPALQNNEINGGILTPQLDLVNNIKSTLAGQDTYEQKDGLEFEHLDFNQTNEWLKDPAIRQAIMLAVDRNQLIAKTVGQFDPTAKPLQNHIFVPGQPGYTDNSGGLYNAADVNKAQQVLTSAGYTLTGSGASAVLTKNGKPVTMRISSTQGNALRASEEQFIVNALAPLGIKVTETDVSSLGKTLGSGNFDMIIFAWVATPFLSGNDAIYQTANSNTGAGGSNYDGYTDPKVDQLISQADTTLDQTQRIAIYNQVDKQLWADNYNLPLFQRATAIVYQNKFANFHVNATAEGPTWNMEDWIEKA
ncbi:MAG TPA: ABC transporter family substrate-binding protein [Acidimicrobiales bacterium]|nr:ABC transporter family substrate-binding protein [Acidimicrobiales bacterium]